MDLLESDKIESRTYQEVIAASAIDQNTLVVLPTGLGKTVIAAMVAAEKLETGKVLFMAPTKPLAEQHLSSFKDFIDIDEDEMAVMTGKTRPDERYDLWENKRAFFATPQVVENDLISGEVPVKDFSLVIFDEAHRATGEYSYVFINDRMRVHKMALTASPGGSKEKIMEVAENLDIENFEVRTEDDPDVEPYIQEREVEWQKVSLDDRFKAAKRNLEESQRDQLKELKKLGHISSTSNVHKGDLLKLRGKISSKLSSSDDPKLYKAISLVATALKISQASELLETQGITQCYRYIDGLETDDSKAAKRALNNDQFKRAKNLVKHLKKKGEEHPKLDKLREILSDMNDDEKALVFTEYRDSTEMITEELETEGLDTTTFIGQQGEKGMSQTQQKEVLEDFRDDEYDVVVSTSIGEEGLDIPSVDYVIFYEPVASGIRDIQRSGRTGRQESGKVYVLMAENTRDEGHYWSAHHKKNNMNSVLQELKEEELETEDHKTLDSFEGEEENQEKEDNKIEIVADDRENKILKKLAKLDIEVNQERLDVADFLVSDRTAVERKQTEDFVDSLVDQRLFSQLPELQQFEKPVLLIEGEELYSHRKIHPNAIRGALASIAVDHGIPVLWADDQEETSEMLKALAKREQEDQDRDVAVRGSKSGTTERQHQEFVVAGLPSVNTKLAKRLLEEFGSIQKVFSASEDELKEVEGIGEKKASSIRSLVEKEYE
ncbi:MAG: DEAD/DEAH box helicase [Nanohaloarchaea archaeon]|nr:DEAD/DEAH box helicase [Candidatus Nanohaloarchaea archaeon]